MQHRLAALLALLPLTASAGIILPREPGGPPLKVRKTLIEVQVRDQVARAVVDEVFENTTDQQLEGQYLLPLPEGAAISGFATWIDGQRVESHVEEKEKAQRTYDAAQAQNRAPAMLEQTAANTFKTKVDGIPAHGTKRVEAQFAQVLPYADGTVTVRIPLGTTGFSGWEGVDDLQLGLDLADQKKIVEVKVPSHPGAKVEQTAKGWRVSLGAKKTMPTDDLVVTYRTESSRLGLSFVPYRPHADADGYFLLLASPQELTTAADIVQKDVVFVFDQSGSMSGEKIAQARDALKRCLTYLNATDHFGIVAFSDGNNPFRGRLVPANSANVREATTFAGGLEAGGSTNIDGALQQAFRMFESERPRVIVFMTDGQPNSSWESIHEHVKVWNDGKTRIFPFGVGNDVQRTELERLGAENRGASDFVGSGETIERVIGGFYSKIARPVLSDLAFDFGDVTAVHQYPQQLPDLYKGSQLVVTGRYRGSGKVKASLTGTLNGKKHAIPFEAEFPEKDESSPFVARIWAQRRIDGLLADERLHGTNDESRREIVALSTAYDIVTPYTSMVAVKAQPTAVAVVSPARVQPGDPVVSVRAPRDAKSVRITLPFGEPKRAKWDESREVWSARFLVPVGTPDGSYPIRVDVEHADGHAEEFALQVEIDTAAPAIVASAGAVNAGQVATLRAGAVLGLGEIVSNFAGLRSPWLLTKQQFDVRRVTAHLWDGREVELALAPFGRGFRAELETSAQLAPGAYPVTFVARDFAGNASEASATLEVR